MGVYFGKVSMILLGLILFPITKLNVFGYLFGWSFDSTIYIHRLCGWFCIWFIVFHVLIITIQKQSIYMILILYYLGIDFLFTWKGKIPVFPGTVAYIIFIFVGLTSRQSVRRKHYMIFYFVFILYIIYNRVIYQH